MENIIVEKPQQITVKTLNASKFGFKEEEFIINTKKIFMKKIINKINNNSKILKAKLINV